MFQLWGITFGPYLEVYDELQEFLNAFEIRTISYTLFVQVIEGYWEE